MAFTLNRRLAQLVDGNGQLNTGKIPNDYITSDHVADNTITSAMLHTSFTVSTSNLTSIDTDDVSEGSTNLYYTDARARGAVSAAGSLSYNSSTGVFSFTQGDTDTVSEGSTNLYYTDARVDSYLSGGTGVTYSSGAISIGQDVGTSATPTFGNITTTGYIAGPATFTIDPAAVGDNTGTVVIAGNLQVDGTTTTINSTTMTVDDLNLTLASGAANAAAANGAGITVDGASATITYDGTNDEWDFNKNVNVAGNITTQSGGLIVGTSDTIGGVITVYGNGTGNNEGGEIQLKMAADHDSTYDHFRLDVVNDTFRIGRTGTTDLTINSSGNATFAGTISSGRINTSDGIADTGQAGSATIFNESGSTADFRIESDTKPHMFFLDGGLNRIGINTASPSHTLHILNEVSSDTIDENNGLVKMQSSGGNGMIFGTIASSPYSSYIQSGYVVDTSAANYAISLNPLGGNIGIGVGDPDEKLEINGKTDYPYLKLSSTNNTSRFMRVGMANATDHVVEANGASTQLLFKTAGSTRLTIGSGGYMENTGGFETTGPLKTGGSSNYLLLDYDGDFTGSNYYAIQDTSDNKLRISYGFSSTNCIDMDSSGNVTIPGGDLVVSGGVISAPNLKRNDQTSGSTIESSLWRSTSSYIYDATNGLRYYWIRVAQIAPSNCRGLIEYETKTDENYPMFTRGTIAYSGFNGGTSFSIQHDQNTAEGVPVVVRVDTSRQIWVQFSAAWASTSRWRITNYASTLTNVDTSWTVGSNKLDPNSTAVPPNSSGNIEPGQNFKATSSSVTGTIPTYDFYKQGNVRSDKQIVDTDVVYNGAEPLNFHYKGSDTYTKTVLYDGQNNTANNVFSGLTWEMGRLTNSSSATPRTFTISDRGAGNKWCFSQYGLSFNPSSNIASAANSLDEYEYGGWTPVLQSVTTTSMSHYSLYTRIGRICHIHAKITATVTSLPGSNFAISGLPFTAKDSSDSQQRALIAIGGDSVNLGAYANGRAHFRTNGTTLQGVWLNSGSTAYWNYNSMDSTSFEIHVHGHYTVD